MKTSPHSAPIEELDDASLAAVTGGLSTKIAEPLVQERLNEELRRLLEQRPILKHGRDFHWL